MHYTEIFKAEDLHDMIEGGYIRVAFHPDLPLEIFCYTSKAVNDQVWNKVTQACRGLILNNETGEVVARPFPKFFNVGEPMCPPPPGPDNVVEILDKIDGSLGIVYNTPDGPAVATKGSFTSEQALHATDLLRAKYGGWEPPYDVTVLVEIVYPENRIVLDYGDRDELVYLATIDIKSGYDRHSDMWWEQPHPFPEANILYFGRFCDAPLQDRPNSEGVVIRGLMTNTRYKVKQSDYLELHRTRFGLTKHTVWEWFTKPGIPDDNYARMMQAIPEEFHGWAQVTWGRMFNKWFDHDSVLDECWEDLYYRGFVPLDRKDRPAKKKFAEQIKDAPDWVKAGLFSKYDHENWTGVIHKLIEPKKEM
jgi:RNA ligase